MLTVKSDYEILWEADSPHKDQSFSVLRLDFNGFYTEKLESLAADRAAVDSSPLESDSGM